ncbi:hypothetical protein TrLO_g14444 [Triparma laevis f. longispina]|uniref:Ubiquitin-like domain-containing protein n=1 Tax=Triparma laevis f. longispina TaxID=1714387 RepID=A0A9W7AKE9_9STRA|nr:hypothetical protein TrLO_g14444 [Triparma laevis f. longispina]
MSLKAKIRDFDAELLLLPFVIDETWHRHILYTKNYTQYCFELCGAYVHHDPDGATMDRESVEKRSVRIAKTVSVDEDVFGESCNWDYGDATLTTTSSVTPPPHTQIEAEQGDVEVKEGEGDEKKKKKKKKGDEITIRTKYQTGIETFWTMKKTSKIEILFIAFVKKRCPTIYFNLLHFCLEGERIGPDETPLVLELEDQEEINVLSEQGGC